MSKIFAGFLFVFLNFNLTLNQTYTVNLLPDFIGFLLLYLGTRELLGCGLMLLAVVLAQLPARNGIAKAQKA